MVIPLISFGRQFQAVESICPGFSKAWKNRRGVFQTLELLASGSSPAAQTAIAATGL
jgi:hypothetical protein